jgi:hypothetical protein
MQDSTIGLDGNGGTYKAIGATGLLWWWWVSRYVVDVVVMQISE